MGDILIKYFVCKENWLEEKMSVKAILSNVEETI